MANLKEIFYSWLHDFQSTCSIDQNTMADAHYTRMHCVRKSFKKANGRLLKDRHKAGGSFLRCAKISHH